MRVLPRYGESTHTKEEIRCFCREIIGVFFPEVFLYVSRRCLHFRGTSLHDYLVRISACWCCTTIMHASFNLSRRAPLHQRQEVSRSITPPHSGVLHAPSSPFSNFAANVFRGRHTSVRQRYNSLACPAVVLIFLVVIDRCCFEMSVQKRVPVVFHRPQKFHVLRCMHHRSLTAHIAPLMCVQTKA